MFSSPMYAAGSSPQRGAARAFGALPFAFVARALQGTLANAGVCYPGLEKYPGVRLGDLPHTEPVTAGLRLVSLARAL